MQLWRSLSNPSQLTSAFNTRSNSRSMEALRLPRLPLRRLATRGGDRGWLSCLQAQSGLLEGQLHLVFEGGGGGGGRDWLSSLQARAPCTGSKGADRSARALCVDVLGCLGRAISTSRTKKSDAKAGHACSALP